MQTGRLWIAALGLWLVSTSVWAADATLKAVHIDTSGHETDVDFVFDSVPRYNAFALSKRAVVDFSHTRSGGVSSVSGGAVRNLRLGRHADGTLRAVLDLHAGAQLGGAHRKGHDIVVTIEDSHMPAGAASDAATSDSSSSSSSATTADTDSSSRDRSRSSDPSSGQPKAVYRAEVSDGKIVVVIDPGHGGKDSGTRAASGLTEKYVNLQIAKHLYERLRQTPRFDPILTRSTDKYITLRRRVQIAQKNHANLFVSIHANAYPEDTHVKGATCYMLSEHGATDAKAAQLAHFENTRDRSLAGVNFSGDRTLNAMLTDLYQNASINDAKDVADDIINQFADVGPIYRNTPPRANFAVLRDPMIPSVLCEVAFLSNPHQAHLLAGSHFRDALADAMYQGIIKYFKDHPPEKMQAVGGALYTVKSGDTLSEIAARQGVSENTIMAINHLHSKTLTAGQKLQLPGGG